ncbi:MAG: Flp pilus assembly complex ATPase component TadA [Magnetococcales bacterium]|nr:Flp pilus assembly complex ATPase component TadA [Magnetococcales bacterium]
MGRPNELYFQVRYTGGRAEELILPYSSEYVLGRKSRGEPKPGQLMLDDQYISRRHCRIFYDGPGDTWVLEDLGSSNGTFVNGEAITSVLAFPPGAELRVGATRVTFSIQPRMRPEQQSRPEFVVGGGTPTAGAEEATMLAAPPRGRGAAAAAEEATMLARPSHGGEDEPTMMVRPSRAPAAEEATILAAPSRGGDEEEPTLMVRPQRGGGEATVMAKAPSLAEAATMLGQTATIVGKPPTPGEAATVMAPAAALDPTILAAPPRAEGAKAAEKSSLASKAASKMGDMLRSQPAAAKKAAPPEAEGKSEGKANPAVQNALGSGVIRELIDTNFLDNRKVVELFNLAQSTGDPFFTLLARDRSIKYSGEIYRWLAKKYDLPLIESEDVLNNRVEETKWLSLPIGFKLGVAALRTSEKDYQDFAVLDPFHPLMRDWLERSSGRSVRLHLVDPNIFYPVLRRLNAQTRESGDEAAITIDITTHDEDVVREAQAEVDAPKVVNFFLFRSYQQKASDIHIEPTEENLMVRTRVDGMLHEELTLPQAIHPAVVSRLKILSGMDVAEKRRPQDGRFSVTIRNNPIDVRVSSFPTVFGEKFVLRLLDKNALRPSIDNLGMMARDLQLLKDKLNAPFGLIMISGPTGSGKTTTLYSCLASMDKDRKNILTVEDPVEYRLKGVHQMQVNHKIGLNFASGLRTILRQDPDVIMVGEIRDQETARMAVQASLTGHIVFSTIHTNDAVGVITRLLDMGIEPFLVATSISMAIAQRLVRTICTRCKDYITGEALLEELKSDGISEQRLNGLGILIEPEMEYARGKGCSHCKETGYTGRQPVFEIFDMTDEARATIMGSTEINAGKLKALARKKGMTSLIDHGMRLVEEEVTTVNEVIRVLGEKQ